ncbi:unnamed protein product [Discosporangium mesarthrocarpum]
MCSLEQLDEDPPGNDQLAMPSLRAMDGMNLPAPGVTLKEFEEDCENPEAVQRDVLRRILEHSKETVHLKGLGITGDTTVDDFRRLHPVTDYSFYESYIDSISSGEKEPNLLLEGLTGFNLSSGTTGKASKMIPATMAGTIGTLDFMSLVNDLMERFGFLRSERAASCCRSGKRITTPSGHIAAGLSTRLLHHPAAGPILAATAISPIKVYNIPEHVPCMYAHGLCALIRRKEVVKITSSYCAMVVDLLVAIQDRWEDMIQHIRTGVAPSDDVAEVDEAVGSLLKPEGDPGLADELEAALGPDRGAGSGSRRDRFRGYVRRVFPSCRMVSCNCTGSMAVYVPLLRWFLNNPQEEEGPSEGQGGGGEGQTGATPASGSIPIWSPMYVASEGWMGVNTDVTESERPAEKAVYTLYPKFVFFEFLPVSRPISALSVPTPPGESQEGRVQGGGEAEKVAADPVLVHELKVGCQYEVMVTNYQGFYRYRLKDIVEVVGFKGKMPRVAFVAREGALLNARSERTSEPTLMQALSDGIKAVNASPQGVSEAGRQAGRTKKSLKVVWKCEGKHCLKRVRSDCCAVLSVLY